MSGTAANAFAGNVRIGSVVAPTVALDVTGAALISTTLGVTGNTTLTGDLAVNGGDITSSASTFNAWAATVTTLNIGAAATTLALGAATGTLTVSNTTLAAKAGTFSTTLGVTGITTLGAPVTLKGYTVATLPAGVQGHTAFVTDALAPAFLTAVVGGGAIVAPVFYDGANWVAI